MIIVEYRVPMPFSALEYQIGQLYTIAKKSKLENESSSKEKNSIRGADVRIIANEPYSFGPGGTSGQYTNKTHYLPNHIPYWIKRLLPESAAKLNEEVWNAYPYSKNKFTNPLCDKLTLEIESRYLDGPPIVENVFDLDAKERNERSIVMIDFVCDKQKNKRLHHDRSPVAPSSSGRRHNSTEFREYQSSDDLYSYRDGDAEILNFEPLFRGALTKNWLQEYEFVYSGFEFENKNKFTRGNDDFDNESLNEFNFDGAELKRSLMTCYKLIRISFPVWPLQSRVEHFIQQYCRDTILESHKQTWLWQDEWTGMNLDEIRKLERETQQSH